MPTNKNALTRIVLLDKLLSDRYHAYSIQDMTNYLNKELPQYGQENGVTKRCVEKDIEYLEYNFPILIEFERYYVDAYSEKSDKGYKKKCIRYADPTFSIFKPKLTDDEKNILSSALQTLGRFEGFENFEWLNDLKQRLDLVEHHVIISRSNNLIEDKSLIAKLFTLIKNKQVITLTYHTFVNSQKRNVIVSPHLLKEYNNRWFLICSANDTGRIITFALDRVDDVCNNYTRHYIETPNNLNERYEDIIGVTYNEEAPVYKIIFWVSDTAKKYIDTKPIHGSQTPISGQDECILRYKNENSQNGAFYYIKCKDNYELIREMCSYGDELIVLSPVEIQNKIYERIDSMHKKYSELRT